MVVHTCQEERTCHNNLYNLPFYTMSQKVGHFYFYDNFSKSGPISIFFTVKFRKDLREMSELKLPPPLKSVAYLVILKQV